MCKPMSMPKGAEFRHPPRVWPGRVLPRAVQGGFTLIEIMVAVGIIAVLMTIAIPSILRSKHEDSMRKAVSDVMEVCSTARARAILDCTTMEVCIRPMQRTFVVQAAHAVPTEGARGPRTFGFQGDTMVQRGAVAGGPSGFSVTLSPHITIEGLGLSGEDWTQDEEAHVQFYQNGTCDEMSLVLLSDRGERRNIWLEVVTGFAEFEVDPFKFKVR